MKLSGIHHITAIATDPQRNLDFYTGVLGLRFVKRTVNFDDPATYHLYFGDRIGTPGTIITFFPWPGARRGTRGAGQVVAASFAIPRGSTGYWRDRLEQNGMPREEVLKRFDEEVLRFIDPDGLLLEVITAPPSDEDVDLAFESPVPNEFAIRGFHTPTLQVRRADATEQLLTQTLGFEMLAEQGNRRRFSVDKTRPAAQVDLVERPDGGFGNIAAGTIHHIAFRAADDEEQLAWRKQLIENGLRVTPMIDRQYFHSIYFLEPGGILFEIATDGPGFTIDEPAERLGENLRLPPQYEADRAKIEQALPPISLHWQSPA